MRDQALKDNLKDSAVNTNAVLQKDVVVQKNIKWGDHNIIMESGRIARQADGSVFIQSGKTAVLCTVVADEDSSIDYLGMSVDYQERFYAVNKVPGGYMKREGKPGNMEILNGRIIDRALRPIFCDGFRGVVHVLCTVMSYDESECPPEILSIIAASAALRIGDLPVKEGVIGVKIGDDGDDFYINACRDGSNLRMIVALTANSISMVEAASDELPADRMVDAIEFAKSKAQDLFVNVDAFVDEVKKAREGCIRYQKNKALQQNVESFIEKRDELLKVMRASKAYEQFLMDLGVFGKVRLNKVIADFRANIADECHDKVSDGSDKEAFVASRLFNDAVDKICSEAMTHSLKVKKMRFDGRKNDEIRSISCSTSFLPKVHGSALFTRGETQVIAAMTVGAASDIKMDNTILGTKEENLMLHYNFLPFSVGEASFLKGPGRREIGHGNLALNAIKSVITDKSSMIRVVSEVTESNGSSSMATVCGASLALMNGGVKMKRHVAGIAMGLVDCDDNFVVLSDIDGLEDRFGCMDYKVAGTRKGITALQMDVKIDRGITVSLLNRAMSDATQGIATILSIMEETSSNSSHNRIVSEMNIPVSKKKDVIGYGGKIIREIAKRSGAVVNIDESGTVNISAESEEHVKIAAELINGIVKGVKPGEVFDAVVRSVVDFGVFVEFGCAQEGLLHISEMGGKKFNMGDEVRVVVAEINQAGKIGFGLAEDDAE